MDMKTNLIAVIFFYSCLSAKCQSVVETNEDEEGVFKDGKISFSTPDLSDDESHSPFMPDTLKCDACLAISYQLYKRFDKFNSLHKYLKYKAPESEVLDIFEDTCESETFSNYGLKQVKGVNRISGEGLETADKPGVLAGGGKWPSRMVDMCEQFAGEVGEMEIYNAYKENPKTTKSMDKFLCYGSGIRGDCTRSSQKKKEEL